MHDCINTYMKNQIVNFNYLLELVLLSNVLNWLLRDNSENPLWQGNGDGGLQNMSQII